MLFGKGRRTMNWEAKCIKKFMGWCPNAKAHGAIQQADPENFDSDIPNRARGENRDLKDPRWLQKESNQILLFSISLTFVS